MAKREPDRLDLESSAAIAAGMSYGYWKAAQSNPVIKKEKKIPDGWLVCEYCGKPFKPKTKRPQKFCEVECQRQACAEKQRQRRAEYMRQYRAKGGEEDGQA